MSGCTCSSGPFTAPGVLYPVPPPPEPPASSAAVEVEAFIPPPGPPPIAVIAVNPVPVIEELLPAFPSPFELTLAPPAPTANERAVFKGVRAAGAKSKPPAPPPPPETHLPPEPPPATTR